MMETFAAIVVALAILTAVVLGIILVAALYAFIVSFLSPRAAAWWDSAAGGQVRGVVEAADHPDHVMPAHQT
jgi:hypothetical protein